MDFAQLEKEVGKLEPIFINLLLFNLMKNRKLSFDTISKQYVKYLESEREDKMQLTNDLAFSLMHHRYPHIVGGETKEEQLKFIHEKAIDALKRTRLFPDELDYMEEVKNPL
jgi:hypothetical protein